VTHPKIEVRIDHPDGQLLGTVTFQPTTGLQDFTTATVPLPKTSGAHDLYLVFKSGGIYLDTVALSGNS